MTAAFAPNPSAVNLPTLPDGWPIGSYDMYQEV